MRRAFYIKNESLHAAVLWLLVFGGMFATTTLAFVRNVPTERIVFALPLAGVWLVPFGLAVWSVLAWQRSMLLIEDGCITKRGVLRTKQVDPTNVVDVKWRIWPRSGSLVLRDSTTRMAIGFGNLDREQRLELIRYFRRRLPTSVQQDWEMFCYKIALRLRDRALDRPLQEGEVRISRRRWDYYMASATLLFTIAGIVAWRMTGDVRTALLAPLAGIPIWAILRFGTPKEGMIVTNASKSETKYALAALGMAMALIFIGLFAISFTAAYYRAFTPYVVPAVLASTFVLLVCVLRRTYILDRSRAAREAREAPLAAARWEAEEADVD